ncbi:hypothetical protein LguiB_032142 [Lonicera macranthoides]
MFGPNNCASFLASSVTFNLLKYPYNIPFFLHNASNLYNNFMPIKQLIKEKGRRRQCGNKQAGRSIKKRQLVTDRSIYLFEFVIGK